MPLELPPQEGQLIVKVSNRKTSHILGCFTERTVEQAVATKGQEHQGFSGAGWAAQAVWHLPPPAPCGLFVYELQRMKDLNTEIQPALNIHLQAHC